MFTVPVITCHTCFEGLASTQTFPNGITIVEYDPSGNFQVPVTYDYNLTIERQLVGSWAARIAYVGSGSRHQFDDVEVKPAVNTDRSSAIELHKPRSSVIIYRS